MPGKFRAAIRRDPSAVCVSLGWDESGSPAGSLVLPQGVERNLAERGYPSTTEPFCVPSAMSYALYIAMTIGCSILVIGDLSAWRPGWGELEITDHEPWFARPQGTG